LKKSDPQKLIVFKHFKKLTRDLNKAFLRQKETVSNFKQGALTEKQIDEKRMDEETIDTVSSLFEQI